MRIRPPILCRPSRSKVPSRSKICISPARDGAATRSISGGAFSPARRVDFRKSGNVQNVRVLRGVQNRRKGCSKFEVVKNRHFPWQAQYLVLLKSVLESSKCSFCETVVEFGSAMLTSFRVAVTGLRMPRTHFFVAGAVLASQNIEKSHFVL